MTAGRSWRGALAALALVAAPAWGQAESPLPPGWAPARLLADILRPSTPPAAAQGRAWRQALLRAEAAGDPLATWVLRLCGSAVALDRGGLDSTCSQEPESVARARQQLLALDLGPSFRLVVLHRIGSPPTPAEVCGAAPGGACSAEATATWLADRLTMAETEAVVHGLAHTDLPLCPAPAAPPSEADLRCQQLRHHLQALRTLVPQHLRPLWTPDDDEARRARQHPYARMEDTSWPPVRRQRDDPAWRPIDEATERFYEGVLRSLQTLERNLQRRLLEDPRWAVFVGRTPPALERRLLPPPPKLAAGQAPPSLNHRHHQQMLRHVGRYRGAAFGTSRQPVLTWLVPSSSGVRGGFAFIRQPHGALQLNLGRLGPCLAGEPQELVCVWHDRYGTGLVSMLFNADSSEFRALWRPVDSGSADFLRMDPQHWDGPTTWNGLLQ